MEDNEDKIWLDKLVTGDKSAYRFLFEKYYYSLYSFTLKYIKDKDGAEDIVQDVLYDLWVQKESYMSVTLLKAYLYTTVRNRCLAIIKHEKIKRKYCEYEENVSHYDFFLENILEEEVYLKLKEAVSLLPGRIAEVYNLSLLGKNNKEICDLLSMTEDAVKSLKKRGKVILQAYLKDLLWGLVFVLMKFT